MFQFKKAQRHKAKLRLAICAPSGAGKTFSALKIAKGMGGRVAVIDTENGSAELYANLFEYDACSIAPPFSARRYVEAIHAAEAAGYDIIIVDSLTHAWAGAGGILNEVDKRKGSGNDFSAWRDVTPQHDELVNAMLQSPAHIIVTMRTKTAYELEKNDKGKVVPVKKGMAPIQRDGLEYEFTVVFDIEDAKKHMATAGKDRTSLFDGQYFIPDENTGQQLMAWLNNGAEAPPPPAEYASEAQRKAIWAGGMKLWGTEEALRANVSRILGREVASTKTLTKADASTIIEEIKKSEEAA